MTPDAESPTLDVVGPDLVEIPAGSNQATANKAKAILCESPGFRDVSGAERSAIAAAFAARNFVVYGKAFDLVKVADPELDLSDPALLHEAIARGELTLVEVKSTSADRDEEFRGHFFSMSTAELLVAQSLGDRFKFAFVNTRTGGATKSFTYGTISLDAAAPWMNYPRHTPSSIAMAVRPDSNLPTNAWAGTER
jgi:hypothetical protein